MNPVNRCPLQQSLEEEVAVSHCQRVCSQEEHPCQQLLEADLYMILFLACIYSHHTCMHAWASPWKWMIQKLKMESCGLNRNQATCNVVKCVGINLLIRSKSVEYNYHHRQLARILHSMLKSPFALNRCHRYDVSIILLGHSLQ